MVPAVLVGRGVHRAVAAQAGRVADLNLGYRGVSPSSRFTHAHLRETGVCRTEELRVALA